MTVKAVEIRLPANGGQPQLYLQYYNENIFPLAIASSEHKVYLNDRYIGTASSKVPVGIPQLNTANADMPIRPRDEAAGVQLQASKSVRYRIETVLRMDVSGQDMKIKTSSTGTVPVSAEAAK